MFQLIQSEPAASCDENERRSATRFPIERPVSYKYARGRTWSEAILGKTLNISSTGVLFFGDTQLIAGKRLQLSISWPVQLDGRCSLKLVAVGSVVRCAGNITAARIEKYEFHLQSSRALSAPPHVVGRPHAAPLPLAV